MTRRDGSVDISSSPWLALQLTAEEVPWAFEVEGESFRAIAGLEALAALLAFRFLHPCRAQDASVVELPRGLAVTALFTDNRSNGFALTKLHAMRYPLAAVVMELACELKGRGLLPEVSWTPREANQEADDLSNMKIEAFNPALRVEVDFKAIDWHVLPQALQWGRELRDRRAAFRAKPPAERSRLLAERASWQKKESRKGKRLRDLDPW